LWQEAAGNGIMDGIHEGGWSPKSGRVQKWNLRAVTNLWLSAPGWIASDGMSNKLGTVLWEPTPPLAPSSSTGD